MRLALLTAKMLISLAATAFFTFAYYDRYWQWRDCFNEEGRCYDSVSGQVLLQQSGIVWGGFTILSAIFLLLSLRSVLRWRRQKVVHTAPN